MCGINGIFAFHYAANPVDRPELIRARGYMAARGPDGAGAWFSEDDRVALGHRRLSIIELTDAGAQPMASADGRLVVTFNGKNLQLSRPARGSRGQRPRLRQSVGH
jgi:asparagine synthase (glutamine-hydrolysing)